MWRIQQLSCCVFLYISAFYSLAASIPFDTLHGAFPVYFPGTQEIRNGDYTGALQVLLKDTAQGPGALKLYKTGIAYAKLGKNSDALNKFRLAALKDLDIAPIAYLRIAEIEIANNRLTNALSAFRTSLSYKIPERYRRYIFTKIHAIAITDSSLLKDSPWLDEYRAWDALQQPQQQINVTRQTLDSLLKIQEWGGINAYFDSLTAGQTNDPSCDLLTIFTSIPAESLHLKPINLFELASRASNCKNGAYASELITLLKKHHRDDNTVPWVALAYLEGQLLFDKGEYEDAAKAIKRCIKKFGATPDAVLLVARAYKKLNKTNEAQKWYELHVKQFPTHKRTEEILWLLAWMREEVGKYKEAALFYTRIYSMKVPGKRAEESYLRKALCEYRVESYARAINALDDLGKKFPQTQFGSAMVYWRAKCLLALDKIDEAKAALVSVSKKDPTDFYAHRARQMGVLIGDTTVNNSIIDTTLAIQDAHRWLDSISPESRKNLSSIENSNVKRGVMLAVAGQLEEADLFLKEFENNYPANLSLQFDLGYLYWMCNSPERTASVGRKLSWRIPMDARLQVPPAVYALMYPTFYSDVIKLEASYNEIDPFLISAVIRQESVFTPSIVSPVGAIGLMQIMPYTGKALSQKIKVPYTNDSLYKPNYNIRYGAFYLRELLNQFNGNIVLVLASYNGGPHNVNLWYLRNKEEEFDLFIEDLAFTETRGYVKKVLANYWTYRLLAQYSPSFFQ